MGVHDGHRKRLKTQFLIHGEDFHDHQLLELLLCYAIPQGDVNGLAHALLDQFGSLAGVFDALPASLTRVDGVGEHTAVLLKLIPKLAGRYSTIRSSPGDILASSGRPGLPAALLPDGSPNEMVYLVCMDPSTRCWAATSWGGHGERRRHHPRRWELAPWPTTPPPSSGPHQVSGLALPSNADLLTTETLARVLREVGVELADHLIFTEDDMVSLKDSGLLNGILTHTEAGASWIFPVPLLI
jgi:DNA repair protein RadC